MSEERVRPSIADALGNFLQLVPTEQQPLLVALAERMAADRYRSWAAQVTDPVHISGLMACADREEEIARRVEALFSDASTIQNAILARNPNLPEFTRSLFAPYSLNDQFALQAQGERLGAATWRSMARKTDDDSNAAAVFLGCALLEEESADFLESLSVD